MSLKWIHETSPQWDASKAAIVGGAPEGVFAVQSRDDGELLPDEWWHVEQDGRVVGYGWMDVTWGDAEILLAVHPEHRGQGIGSFILDQLETEAAGRGLNYMYNVVRSTHPDRQATAKWLTARGFQPAHDDERLQRRVRL